MTWWLGNSIPFLKATGAKGTNFSLPDDFDYPISWPVGYV